MIYQIQFLEDFETERSKKLISDSGCSFRVRLDDREIVNIEDDREVNNVVKEAFSQRLAEFNGIKYITFAVSVGHKEESEKERTRSGKIEIDGNKIIINLAKK